MMGLGYDIPALALRRTRRAGPAPFSPLSTAPSALFDPANAGTLFQDSTGATPVTADGQPLGLWRDLSANENDLSQSVSAARPTYRTDGTFHWLETDGIDDGLATLPVFKVGNPVTMVVGYQMLSTVGTARVNLAEISKTSTNGMSIGVRPNIDRLQYYSRMAQHGVSASNVVSPSVWGGHDKHVISVQATPGHVAARLDGAPIIDKAQNLTSQEIANQPLRVGLGVVTGSIPGAFRLFGLQVWASESIQPDAQTIVALEQWMASRMGVSL